MPPQRTFKLDAIVAAAAEVLRESPFAEGFDLRDVTDVLLASSEDLPQTNQAHDFLEFLEAVEGLGD